MRKLATMPLLLELIFTALPVSMAHGAPTCQIYNLNIKYPSTVNVDTPFAIFVSFTPYCSGYSSGYAARVLEENGDLVGQATSTSPYIIVPVTLHASGHVSLTVQVSALNSAAFGETGWTVSVLVSSAPVQIIAHPLWKDTGPDDQALLEPKRFLITSASLTPTTDG